MKENIQYTIDQVYSEGYVVTYEFTNALDVVEFISNIKPDAPFMIIVTKLDDLIV